MHISIRSLSAFSRFLNYGQYEIDALNPLAEQTIGVKCKHQMDKKTTTCKNNEWILCAPHRNTKPPRSRCNFDELTKHLGSAPPLKALETWGIDDADGKLNTEETAKKVYTKLTTSTVNKVPNFLPYKATKGAGIEYNDFLLKLTTAVNSTYSTKKTDANKHLWASFDSSTLEKINIARTQGQCNLTCPKYTLSTTLVSSLLCLQRSISFQNRDASPSLVQFSLLRPI